MSSSLDHKCQRCGSNYQGQICPFCTITGLDVHALLAAESLTMSQAEEPQIAPVSLVDVVTGRVYIVTTPVCRIGRDLSNDIILSGDKSLSRFHWQITFLENQYYVEDAGSRNGTFLNGSPVQAPRQLLNGDVLSAGMSRYRFVVEGGESSTADTSTTAETTNIDGGGGGELTLDSVTAQVDASRPAGLPSAPTEPGNHKNQLDDAQPESEAIFELDDSTLLELDDDAFEEVLTASKFHTEAVSKPTLSDLAASMGIVMPKDPVKESAPEPASPTTPAKSIDLAKELADELNGGGGNEAPAKEISQSEAATLLAQTIAHISMNPQGDLPKEWPEWTKNVHLQELVDKQTNLDSIVEQIKDLEEKSAKLKAELAEADNIKNRLLATKGKALSIVCGEVFDMLGWVSEVDAPTPSEILLRSLDGTPVAIARLVCTDSQPKPADLSGLVGSISNYWSNHGTEPKGLMIVAIHSDQSPAERPEISKDSVDYASKKGLCLLTPLQLLAIYRKVKLQGSDAAKITSALLGESGQLQGFTLD